MAKVPVKLLVMQRLTELLKTTPYVEGEDEFDLSSAVFRGRPLFGKEDSQNGLWVNIIEAPRQDPGAYAGDNNARRNTWELYIQGCVFPSAEQIEDFFNPTDATYRLAALIEQRLGRLSARDPEGRRGGLYPDDYLLGLEGRGVAGVEIGPSLVRPPSADAEAVLFQSLLIELSQKVASPYIEVDD